jgi:hypothetical protein
MSIVWFLCLKHVQCYPRLLSFISDLKKDEIYLTPRLTSIDPSPLLRLVSHLSLTRHAPSSPSHSSPVLGLATTVATHWQWNFRISPLSPHPIPSLVSHWLGASPLCHGHLSLSLSPCVCPPLPPLSCLLFRLLPLPRSNRRRLPPPRSSQRCLPLPNPARTDGPLPRAPRLRLVEVESTEGKLVHEGVPSHRSQATVRGSNAAGAHRPGA